MARKDLSIAVMVKDPKKSAKWFVDNFGFETEAEDHWVTVYKKGADWKIHLCKGEPEPGNSGIAFYFKDAMKSAGDLRKKGVKFSRPVKKESWGTMGMIEDADGNGYWMIEGEP